MTNLYYKKAQVTLNYLIMNKLLVLDKNTWN